MDKYPNVTIERTSKSFSDLQKQVELAISGDNPPDVVQANNARGDMGAFVQAGLLRQLDGYADVYGWDDRFPETVRSVSSYTSDGKTFGEGNLYGVPLTGEMVGVWYNKAKLEELGIDPPQTVEDFEAALQTAKDAGEIPIQFGDLDQWPGIHEFGFVQNLFVPPDDIRKLGFGQRGCLLGVRREQAGGRHPGRLGRQGLLHRRLQRSGLRPVVAGLRQGQGCLPDLRHLAAGRPAGRDGRRPRLHAAADGCDRRPGGDRHRPACRSPSPRRASTRTSPRRTSTSSPRRTRWRSTATRAACLSTTPRASRHRHPGRDVRRLGRRHRRRQADALPRLGDTRRPPTSCRPRCRT